MGDHLIFRRAKGGISCKRRTQAGASLRTWEGFRRGITQICLENEEMEGIAKVIKSIRGDHSSEVTFKGGIS